MIMIDRFYLKALLLVGLALSIAGCTANKGLDSITVTPTTDALVVGGPTLQLKATGTYGNAAHSTTSDITTQVTWTSSIKGVASVDPTGVVTAVSAGTTAITATAQGYKDAVSGSVNVTVTGGSSVITPSSTSISLSIIPSAQSVASP